MLDALVLQRFRVPFRCSPDLIARNRATDADGLPLPIEKGPNERSRSMKTLSKNLAAAALAASALALTATTASAEIVCNNEGDCWHVHRHYEYKPEFGLVIHPDGWTWTDADHDRYRWREHEGEERGYWHNGVWITF